MSNISMVSWQDFQRKMVWLQGEHIALIGPTGCGKTTLALNLLPKRKYVVVFGTKPKDATLKTLIKSGYKKAERWGSFSTEQHRRVLWPDAKDLSQSIAIQRREFSYAMNAIYTEGAWCVFVDELWYITHHLKMELEIRTYLQQARSLGISLMLATQRPSRVPLEIFDQSTHIVFFRDNDERNLKRMSGIGFLSAKLIQNTVAGLPLHHFLYINTRTGIMIQSQSPKV